MNYRKHKRELLKNIEDVDHLDEGILGNIFKGITNFGKFLAKKAEDLDKVFSTDDKKFDPASVKPGQSVMIKSESGTSVMLSKIGDMPSSKMTIFNFITTTNDDMRGKLESAAKEGGVLVMIETKVYNEDQEVPMTVFIKGFDMKIESLTAVANHDDIQKKLK
jgi:hypothetical protein